MFLWGFVWKQDTDRCIAGCQGRCADFQYRLDIGNWGGNSVRMKWNFSLGSLISLSRNCEWECFSNVVCLPLMHWFVQPIRLPNADSGQDQDPSNETIVGQCRCWGSDASSMWWGAHWVRWHLSQVGTRQGAAKKLSWIQKKQWVIKLRYCSWFEFLQHGFCPNSNHQCRGKMTKGQHKSGQTWPSLKRGKSECLVSPNLYVIIWRDGQLLANLSPDGMRCHFVDLYGYNGCHDPTSLSK